jgi:hypothetical protein
MKAVALSIVVAAACITAAVTKLTPDEFVVKARVARYWKFSVNGGVKRLVGNFRASGGAHNDIRVLVTDSDECENYINGNRANVFYDSGQKTVGKFDVNLNEASYCLIFDNRNSLVSAKEVAAQVDLIGR